MGSIKHAKNSQVQNTDPAKIGGDDWNNEHEFELEVSDVLGLEARLLPVDQVVQYRDEALGFRNEAAQSALDAAESAEAAENPPFTDPIAPTYLKTISDIINGIEVSFLRFVPTNKHAGIFARTDVSDLVGNYTDAFNAIRDAKRGALFQPAGLYHSSGQLLPPASMRWRAAGPATVLQPVGTITGDEFIKITTDDVQISDLQISADRATYPALRCVSVSGAARVKLHDLLMLKSGAYGLTTENCVDVVVERLRINAAQIVGILHAEGDRIATRFCSVSDVTESHGIQYLGGTNVEMENCLTYQTGQFGANMYGTVGGRIANHRSFDSKLEGINLLNSSYIQVTNFAVSWTGDPTWASTDFGVSAWGDGDVGVNGGACRYNRFSGGTINVPRKSGVALADDCQFVTIDNVIVTNPNSLDEVQGAAVLFYGSGVQNCSVSGITALATNGKMRHAINEQNAGGAPSNNHFRAVDSVGHSLAIVNKVASSSYLASPNTGTIATLEGVEEIFNKTIQTKGTTQFGASLDVASRDGAAGWANLTVTHQASPSTPLSIHQDETGSASIINVSNDPLTLGTNNLPALVISAAGDTTASGALKTSSDSGMGYATGAGGTVTQATSKTTGVTLNKITGTITTSNASIPAGTAIGFIVTNSKVAASDSVVVHRKSGGTNDVYSVWVDSVSAGSFRISISNNTGGALAEVLQLKYEVRKSVDA